MQSDPLTHTPSVPGVVAVYPGGADAAPTTRYRLNLVLFCAASVLISLWFFLHLRMLVSQVLILSGTLTFWGLWKLIEQVVSEHVDRRDMTRRLLAHENATQYLGFGCIVATVALLFTSSFYVVYGPSAGGKNVTIRVDEEVTEDGKKTLIPLMSPQSLHPSRTVIGEILPPRWSRTLIFTVVSPPGKKPVRKELHSLSAVHLELLDPDEFKNADYTMMRLVFTKLPANAEIKSPYTVQVLRGSALICEIQDAHLRTHYLGAPYDDLLALVPRDDPAYTARIERYLADPGFGDTRQEIRESLLAPPEIHKSENLKKSDPLSFLVRRSGDVPKTWETAVTIGSAALQTCFMEIMNDVLSVRCE